MTMVNVVTIAASLGWSWSAWSKGRRPPGAVLYSSDERIMTAPQTLSWLLPLLFERSQPSWITRLLHAQSSLAPEADTRFIFPYRAGGWVDLGDWLQSETVYVPVESHKCDQAWHNTTPSIKTNALARAQTANQVVTTTNNCHIHKSKFYMYISCTVDKKCTQLYCGKKRRTTSACQ